MKHDIAVCPGALLVTGCWELFQWTARTPSSDLSLIVATDLELQVVCRGNNNWCRQNHFPKQFAGPSLLHSIARSKIGFSITLFLCAMPGAEKACSGCSPRLLSFWGWLTFPAWSKWGLRANENQTPTVSDLHGRLKKDKAVFTKLIRHYDANAF